MVRNSANLGTRNDRQSLTAGSVANRIDVSADTVRRRFSRLLVTAIVLGLAVAIGSLGLFRAGTVTEASHVTFTVDDIGDAIDASIGDGACLTAGAKCTLRAAIEEANAHAGTDTINFSIAGPGPHTITPGIGGLPTITDPVIIDGTSEPDFAGTPIVELNGTSTQGWTWTG